MDNLNIHFFVTFDFVESFCQICRQDAQIINMIDKILRAFDTSYFYYLLSKKPWQI